MDTSPLSAFVAGATGYTGRAVVKRLRALDVTTYAHVRPNSPSLDRHRASFETLGAKVVSPAWEEEAIAETIRQLAPTHIFCLLGTTAGRAKRERKAGQEGLMYEAVDYGMTKMVIDAASSIDPLPTLVYLSAMGVGSKRPSNRYMRARWQVEQALGESSLPWIVARPAFISGPDREEWRPSERIGAIITDGLLRLGGQRLRNRFGSLSAEDLAEGLVYHALERAERRVVLDAEALRERQ